MAMAPRGDERAFHDPANADGRVFALFCQTKENEALQCMVGAFQSEGLTVGSLIYDGCLVPKSGDIQAATRRVEAAVRARSASSSSASQSSRGRTAVARIRASP